MSKPEDLRISFENVLKKQIEIFSKGNSNINLATYSIAVLDAKAKIVNEYSWKYLPATELFDLNNALGREWAVAALHLMPCFFWQSLLEDIIRTRLCEQLDFAVWFLHSKLN